MNITKATAKGKRPYQEDRFCSFELEGFTVLGVFDGHGGDEVSDFCAENLAEIYSKTSGSPRQRLRQTIKNLHYGTEWMDSGSTASIVAIGPDKVAHCCVLGDSPILTRDRKGKLRISPEHNVRSNEKERKAAEARGGIYYNGYIWNDTGDYGKGLQMSRALGDSKLHKILSRVPQTYKVILGEQSWVLVGSDGLFDPGHTSTTDVELIASAIDSGVDAQGLVEFGLSIPANDNVTAVLVRM